MIFDGDSNGSPGKRSDIRDLFALSPPHLAHAGWLTKGCASSRVVSRFREANSPRSTLQHQKQAQRFLRRIITTTISNDPSAVMAGLVPAIHVFAASEK